MDRWNEARAAAMSGFEDQGPAHLNCAQAVVLFTARALGLDDDLITVARYMGGGSVGMGEICGAVEGAVTSLGLRDYHAPDEYPSMTAPDKQALQDLIRGFTDEFGAVTCRALTGYDISSKEGYADFKADAISGRCNDYVAYVCDHLRPLLGGR